MPSLVKSIDEIRVPDVFRNPNRKHCPGRFSTHCRDVRKGNDECFVPEKLRRSPFKLEVNVFDKHVGGYEKVRFGVLWQHGAVVFDLVQIIFRPDIFEKLEFSDHTVAVDTSALNT